ncbi:MAG TPA: lipopolysaccharide assembly protein LapA domain-containing protein [Acetobacteraceae bacterium]|nr:lipopolysaccharide assembly protein LapA domain-containing protein [Acetobacteraceae bacterium]
MIRLIIALPVLLILVLFALSNRGVVSVGFWPTDFTWQTPLSVAVLVGMAVAFLLGAVLAWIGTLAQARRARRAERQVRLLEAEVATLKARLPTLSPAEADVEARWEEAARRA